MTVLHDLAALGQSIWYDNISRSILDSGEYKGLLERGVLGVTSNPSIFEKAIAQSNDYDEAIAALPGGEMSANDIYESLAIADIGRAADLLRPVYDATNGIDGYVSLEVSPLLASDTAQTIAEARRLFAALHRPNIMIKVPATPEGIPAVETLIGEGMNINVTLIFSQDQYAAVAEAYIHGLEKLAASGADLSKVASVASVFVSRVDAKVDVALAELGNTDLQGKIALANARMVYALFGQLFSGARWEALVTKGARVQRPLWASTGTKNPSYPDTLYVDALIGPNTVNTVPPATLDNVFDHVTVASPLLGGTDEAHEQLAALAALGISLDAVTNTLLDEGVISFANAFKSLMKSVEAKQAALQGKGA